MLAHGRVACRSGTCSKTPDRINAYVYALYARGAGCVCDICVRDDVTRGARVRRTRGQWTDDYFNGPNDCL